jgi:hypothetical protein
MKYVYLLPYPKTAAGSLVPGIRKRSGMNLSVSMPYVVSSWRMCLSVYVSVLIQDVDVDYKATTHLLLQLFPQE